MSTDHLLKERASVPQGDRWDLTCFFSDDKQWEAAFDRLKESLNTILSFKGILGESSEALKRCLDYMTSFNRDLERLSHYAFLRLSEDGSDSTARSRHDRIARLASEAGAACSYFEPELLALSETRIHEYLTDPCLAGYEISLKKILRYKPHILSDPEERILAFYADCVRVPDDAFSALNDVDLDFGSVTCSGKTYAVTHASYRVLMKNPDRPLREAVYKQYMEAYKKNSHTLASLYKGSVVNDLFTARVRKFPSAREASLFEDDVASDVYDNLINTVRASIPVLHAYYRLRKKIMGLSRLALYDLTVPLVPDITVHTPYADAVDTITAALSPLGVDYCRTLGEGLRGGWVDKYENKGKRSGAFSMGSYDCGPRILMNYREDSIDDVFTLAHEGGHAMHSLYSAQSNPFQHYQYTIFAAEVASTFNEQLLGEYYISTSSDDQVRAYIVNRQIECICGTFFRQTMFAEFEKQAHELMENGGALTVDSICGIYNDIIREYYGPDVDRAEYAKYSALRIPHFYSAFYVYKYATGIAAAIALSRRVMNGGTEELSDYIGFLKSGGSRYPLEQLKAAGVDMTSSGPIEETVAHFSSLVSRLDSLLVGGEKRG